MLDRYQRFSARLGYSWIRSRNLNTSSILALDAAQETLKLDLRASRTDFSQDRLRVLRLTQTGDVFLPWDGRLNGSVTASFGLDGLGARQGTAALPMTRDGAKPDFRKLDVTASYTQPFLNNRVYLSLAAKAQTSFGSVLVSSEQFGLGGADWVSAYRGGQFQGDSGAAFRSEVSLPVTLPSFAMLPDLGSAVMPYLFAAGGFAKLEKPSAAEKEYLSAGAFGAGLRVALSQRAPHIPAPSASNTPAAVHASRSPRTASISASPSSTEGGQGRRAASQPPLAVWGKPEIRSPRHGLSTPLPLRGGVRGGGNGLKTRGYFH
ncbi:ShlB/FhaC/HecB family hemolysin secretion/activation protein [Pannonibacter sp. Pt2-lr]